MSSPDPTPLHRARLLANAALSRVGLAVVRAPRQPGVELIPLKIGKYEVMLPASNPLCFEHGKNPEYTAQLGRLAGCVFRAYPAGYAIDVGANIGDTAAIIKSQADVSLVCVEGDAALIPLLERNLAQMGEAKACQCFLGERTETLQVVTNKDGWDTTLIPIEPGASDSGKSVSLVSLDDLVKRLAFDRPCKLLKLDIEGFDLRVLRGAPKLLARDQPALHFEFNHENLTALREDGLEIFPYLASLGYDQMCIFDGQGRFILPCRTTEAALLADLDDYAKGLEWLFYYDICAFHSSDSDLARGFLASERSHRKSLFTRRRA